MKCTVWCACVCVRACALYTLCVQCIMGNQASGLICTNPNYAEMLIVELYMHPMHITHHHCLVI